MGLRGAESEVVAPGLRGWSYVRALTLLAGAYVLAAKWGLSFAFAGANVSPLWPPSGVAVGALLLWGPTLWPGVLVGAFLANRFVSPLPGWIALGIALGNCGEAWVAAALLRSGVGFRPSLLRLKDVFGLVLIGAGLAPMVSASTGAFMLAWGKLVPWEAFGQAWRTWWTGDAMGVLVVAPALLVWTDRPWRGLSRLRGWAGVLVFSLLAGIGWFVFMGAEGFELALSPASYLVLPLVVLAAYAFGPPGGTAAVLLASGLAVWGTLMGRGAYSGFRDLNEKMALLQGFIATAAISSLGIAALVSERKAVEARLTASEQRSRAVAETAHDAIVLADSGGHITGWNQAAERMFGYSETEALDQPLDLIVPERYREAHEKGLAHYLATGESRILGRTVEMEGLRRQGEVFPIEFSISTWTDGTSPQFTGILRDITERKRAEGELQRREAQLEEAQRIAHVGSWEWDVGADRVTWSQELYRIYGLEAGAFKATYQGFLDRVHPEDRDRVDRTVRAAVESGPSFEFEHRILRPSGDVRVLQAHGEVIRDEAGRLTRMTGTGQDVTERKALEDRLQALARDLEGRVERRTEEVMLAHRALEHRAEELARSNRDLEQFATVASHDLQEPLRMVASFTQLLASRYGGRLGPEADEYLQFIVKGAKNMGELIQALLTYAQIGRSEQPWESTSLEEVLDKALSNLEAALKESRPTIARSPLPEVTVDRIQWVQLFQNLLGNAIKFRDWRPLEIEVGTRKLGGDCLFWVRDNGIGIEARYLDRIFILFQRLHAKGEYSGTGIGLSLCKRIVERHGGRIWAESVPGEGTTFYFTLPSREEAWS